MRPFITAVTLVALLTVPFATLPASAHSDVVSLESRFALEASPRLEASTPTGLKSPTLSVGLSVATPLALTGLGSGLMLLSGYPNEVNALGGLGMALWAASPLALGAGQAYAGDPQRGLWVGVGTYGAMLGSLALGLGVAYAVAPKAMEAGGQSAGMGYALLALPIASLVTAGYTIWALVDAHQTAVRHNAAASPVAP